MHKLTFFPLGNADCCRIDLEAGEKILFDYADMRCAEDDSDLRIDLPAELRQDLKAAIAIFMTRLDTIGTDLWFFSVFFATQVRTTLTGMITHS